MLNNPLIYRVSTVYLPYIYRVCTVVVSGMTADYLHDLGDLDVLGNLGGLGDLDILGGIGDIGGIGNIDAGNMPFHKNTGGVAYVADL